MTSGDVGRRVSSSTSCPNGYVGEATGVLETWDEAANTYVVRTKDGELKRVPAHGVRFGRVVSG